MVTCPLCQRTITNNIGYEPSMLVLAQHLQASHPGFLNSCACGKGIAMSTGSTWHVAQWLGWHLLHLDEPLDDHLLYHALSPAETPLDDIRDTFAAGLTGILTNAQAKTSPVVFAIYAHTYQANT